MYSNRTCIHRSLFAYQSARHVVNNNILIRAAENGTNFQVIGAPLAASLLHLDGIAGLRGWQWLFLAEGIPTVVLGLLMPFLLPASPAACTFLLPAEAATVQAKVAACRDAHLAHSGGCHVLLNLNNSKNLTL
jgi:hypothetical protein